MWPLTLAAAEAFIRSGLGEFFFGLFFGLARGYLKKKLSRFQGWEVGGFLTLRR